MVVPTVVIGGLVGICFAMGASPPDGLLRQPRAAPWDLVTATKVLDARALPAPEPGADEQPIDPVGVVGTTGGGRTAVERSRPRLSRLRRPAGATGGLHRAPALSQEAGFPRQRRSKGSRQRARRDEFVDGGGPQLPLA